MERYRRLPDPPVRLEGCCRAVIEATRERVVNAAKRLIIGGKSMGGGRIASQAVAGSSGNAANNGGLGVAGLVFLGYPLYSPCRPDHQRAAHLPSIQAPMLFVQ